MSTASGSSTSALQNKAESKTEKHKSKATMDLKTHGKVPVPKKFTWSTGKQHCQSRYTRKLEICCMLADAPWISYDRFPQCPTFINCLIDLSV